MSVGGLGIRPLIGLAGEVRAGAGDDATLVLDGARELVPPLAKDLRAGGEPSAVVERGSYERAAVLVWVGPPDEDALRAAARAGVPVVGLSEGESLPYVLDSDLVRLEPGKGFPREAIARAVARVTGPAGVGLAARLPVLRGAVVDELIESCARRNALIGAASFRPGADLPLLTLNELRLVLQVALANGAELGLSQAPELLVAVAAGFGSRSLARVLRGFAPEAGFALTGALAYGVTRAIGELARVRFAPSVRRGT